ncbi:ATP-binding protein [Solidesulfovibrio carbinoliphilus]|uniref:ATP-binding protein n=1 Tax=Solidesulfovibrio carbinoliphilus TaxID=345370 RepID=UPI0012F51981|nr:ATP-binding protein [Solidesulfovibrio carbinoliphilus]
MLDTVVEAVANSLHAGATNISIAIGYQDGTDSKKYIRSIEVSDNGAGFHIENQGSFNEFMSDYKLKIGGRGVGRFAYLKVFSIVKYESTYKGDDEFTDVGFIFDEKFEASYFRISKSMRKSTGTKLILSGIKKKFDTTKQAARSSQDVKAYLLEKLLIEFSMNNSFAIDIVSKDFDKETICNRDIPEFEESKFKISREEITKEKMLIRADEEFLIKYFFKKMCQQNHIFVQSVAR